MRHKYFSPAVVLSAVLCVAGRAQQSADSSSTSGDADKPVSTAVNTQAMLPSLPEPPGKDMPPSSSDMQPAEVNGTVLDVNGDLIPGATVVLDGAGPADHRTVAANDSAFFQFGGLTPGVPYHLTIKAHGFENWNSTTITLASGQFFDVIGIKLKPEVSVSSVTVYSSTEQIATQQVELAEQQRILGFIPNFYVVYDSKNAVPLTTKLKFQMAYRVSIDPVSILGAAALAGMNQAGDTPDYPEGARGYGERFGAAYADGLTDVMFGGAILPSLLHQDPRYFYQGTGTVKSRMLHAMASPFVCRGDNGKPEPNFSSMGGDLISSAISNAYYPPSNRGVSLTFENLLLSTGERAVSSVVQEFVIRKLTPSAKQRN